LGDRWVIAGWARAARRGVIVGPCSGDVGVATRRALPEKRGKVPTRSQRRFNQRTNQPCSHCVAPYCRRDKRIRSGDDASWRGETIGEKSRQLPPPAPSEMAKTLRSQTRAGGWHLGLGKPIRQDCGVENYRLQGQPDALITEESSYAHAQRLGWQNATSRPLRSRSGRLPWPGSRCPPTPGP
jgi:hypothetical protein